MITFSRSPTASLLFLARDFFSPAIPRAKRPFATTLCQLRFTSRGAGRPFPSLPDALGIPPCRDWRTSTSEAPVPERRAGSGCGPARRLRGAARKQRQLVTQHGVAGPRNAADAASAVIGERASASEPGSHEGLVFTVTGRCQTAILLLKSATSPEQQRAPASGSQARGQKDHVYQGLCICSYRRVLLLEFKTSLRKKKKRA